MCCSVTSTVEDSSGPGFQSNPGMNLIAVTLRGVSQFPTEPRQPSVLSVRARSLPSACSLRVPQSSRYCTTIIISPCRCLMCFYQHDKISRRVPIAQEDTTNKRTTVLDATGCRWMKYSGRASSSSVSVAHVPMCVYRGTGSQPEHKLYDGNK